MKKFFSLMMVLALVAGAQAAPAKKVFERKNLKAAPAQIAKFEAHALAQAPARRANIAFVDTTDIVCTDLDISLQSFWGMSFYLAVASNADYEEVEIYFYEVPQGVMTEADADDISVYLTPAGGEYFSCELISATVAQNEIDAWVYDAGGHVYHLMLSLVIPDPTDTVSVVFDEPVARYYYATTGDYYIAAEKEGEMIAFVDIFEDEDLAGHYTADDIDAQYTGIYLINGTDTASVGGFYTIEVDVQSVEGGDSIFVVFFGKDGHVYDLHMFFAAPVAVSSETLDPILGAQFGDYREDYNEYQILGYSTDSLNGISIMVVAQSIGGSYTEKNLDPEYSVIRVNGVAYSILGADFTVSLSEDGEAIIAQGTILASNHVEYTFSMSTAAPTEGIEDVQGAAEAKKFFHNGQLIIRVNDLQYNAQGAILR